MIENKEPSPPQVIYMSPQTGISENDEIDLFALAKLFWRQKWIIFGFSFVCTCIIALYTLFIMPELFTSKIVLQPSSNKSKASNLLGTVGEFLPIGLTGENDKTQIIMNYLNSDSIKTWMIKKYDLLPRLFRDKWDPVNNEWLIDDLEEKPTITIVIQKNILKKLYAVEHDETTGLITISFTDEVPEFTAKIVTGIAEELDRYLEFDNLTDAKRNRLFIEGQLAKAKEEVEYWESRIPNEEKTASEILRETEATLAVYAEMRKQYELAKIEEAKQVVAFKVLDHPLVPEIRSSPKRTLICLVTMIGSAFLAVFFVLLIEFLRNQRKAQAAVSNQ